MSSCYQLYLAPDQPLEQLMEFVIAATGDLPPDKRVEESRCFARMPGFTLHISSLDDFAQTLYAINFDITRSTVSIEYCLNKFEDTQTAKAAMLKTIWALMEKVPGDAALTFDYNYVDFVRRNNELLVNTTLGFWQTETLDTIPVPYTKAELNFIDPHSEQGQAICLRLTGKPTFERPGFDPRG